MRKILIALIRVYQVAISPLFPPSCRFVPTCSAYAVEAITVHGPVRGSLLAAWRILRCHPFSKGGLDPVPPKSAGKKPDSSRTPFATGMHHG